MRILSFFAICWLRGSRAPCAVKTVYFNRYCMLRAGGGAAFLRCNIASTLRCYLLQRARVFSSLLDRPVHATAHRCESKGCSMYSAMRSRHSDGHAPFRRRSGFSPCRCMAQLRGSLFRHLSARSCLPLRTHGRCEFDETDQSALPLPCNLFFYFK